MINYFKSVELLTKILVNNEKPGSVCSGNQFNVTILNY